MGAITRIIAKGVKYTKSLSKTTTREVRGVANLPQNVRNSFELGMRLAERNRMGVAGRVKTTGISLLKKGINPSLPGIFAGIGSIIPAFGTGPLGLAVGKILQKLIRKI